MEQILTQPNTPAVDEYQEIYQQKKHHYERMQTIAGRTAPLNIDQSIQSKLQTMKQQIDSQKPFVPINTDELHDLMEALA